ncbi:NAD(P)H-dependent oxidoreductase subunit E [uncultured Sphingosinicella sp.]|jgi:formate dehydrogenase subunit gamma|uniref:NAD(P)H-dependent oxidoreductase subunit E n=1 Tax=uncultured Sphingosinicella sp. TaxID=478748 RepID=UPI0030DBD3B3|tara:strand:- start:40952 stop:41374 length:423 start_codon:yes stop_codon:yes gene_type:complete
MREDRLTEIIAAHSHREGALLPILNDVQAAFGCVDEDAMRSIAAALNLSRAEVHGVVSFYHDYKAKADPRPVLKLCRAEACQARGVEALVAGAEKAAGERVHVETVYCLGLCSVGPAAMANGSVHARLDGNRLAALIEAL